jgi:adenylate cyclase
MSAWLVAALAALALGVLALLQRRRMRVLERRLEAATLELQSLQDMCARFVPSRVVDKLLTEGGEVPAERKVVTALFADLVGYSALSGQLEPPVLARVLNGYFQRVSDAVSEHHGYVSTFLGDGILAYFGALEPNPWQCNDAARAALEVRAALRAYNDELARDGLPQLAVGIGLHRGPGLAAMIGSRERREYAFVGRTVNLAARVQALTREHRVDILLTQEVRSHLDPEFALREMPPSEVKGFEGAVQTFALVGAARAPDVAARTTVQQIPRL